MSVFLTRKGEDRHGEDEVKTIAEIEVIGLWAYNTLTF